jgi:hypothetical protein
VAVATGRPEGAADRDHRDDGHEDAELRLDDGGHHGQHGRTLGTVAPQLAKREQEEHNADRVDLAPHDRVEPGDRVQDDEPAADERRPTPGAELAGHRPHEPAQDDVGDDRGQLDEVAHVARQDLVEQPDAPQDIEIARRVVVEEVALVEPEGSVLGEVRRPEAERLEVDLETGAGKRLCQNEANGEPEREDDEDRAGGVSRPGRPLRRLRAPFGRARRGTSHRGVSASCTSV